MKRIKKSARAHSACAISDRLLKVMTGDVMPLLRLRDQKRAQQKTDTSDSEEALVPGLVSGRFF